MFKRKIQKSELKIGDQWSVIEGQNNGLPMIIRKNTWCKEIQGAQAWPYRTGIAFKLLENSENGLPTVNESEKLNNLEDSLFAVFQENNESIVALIITTSGFREFVLYSGNPDIFKVNLEKLQSLYPDYQLTNYVENDKKWNFYKSFK